MLPGYQKISVNLSDEVLGALREMAARNNVTVTEALRRSISTQVYLEEASRNGCDLLLRDKVTKETERVKFL